MGTWPIRPIRDLNLQLATQRWREQFEVGYSGETGVHNVPDISIASPCVPSQLWGPHAPLLPDGPSAQTSAPQPVSVPSRSSQGRASSPQWPPRVLTDTVGIHSSLHSSYPQGQKELKLKPAKYLLKVLWEFQSPSSWDSQWFIFPILKHLL